MNKFNILFITLFIIGCSSNNDWTVLFDGERVKGLRGYKEEGFPNSWEIVDGTLKTIPGYGVDLISVDIYNNFELELEWKVPEGGNSGMNPVGEFNQVRIKVKDNHVEHWLNGTKVVEYEYQSDAMWDLVAKSKFNTMPLFAKASEGHIGIQGDHGEIWYRNIRIRKLN